MGPVKPTGIVTQACRPSGYNSHQPSRTSHPSVLCVYHRYITVGRGALEGMWDYVHSGAGQVTGPSTFPLTKFCLPLQKGELVRWMGAPTSDADGVAAKLAELEEGGGGLIECETWSGDSLVLPTACLSAVADQATLCILMGERPRAEVLFDHETTGQPPLVVQVS